MKRLMAVAVCLAVASAACAETAEYVWDGTLTEYGGHVAVAYDGTGKVTSMTTSVAKGDRVVFVGDTTATFAADAVITANGLGMVVFSNEVVTAGGLTMRGAAQDILVDSGANDISAGKSMAAAIEYSDFSELRVKAAEMHYMSGATDVPLTCKFYYEKITENRYEVQGQDWNGAWTRCVKIELTPTFDGGVVVRNVYARQTSEYQVYHLGEDFDAGTLLFADQKYLWLRNVKITHVFSPDFRKTVFAGKLTSGGAITVSNGGNCVVTGAAIGAQDGARCDLNIVFDNGVFEFLDCGQFTHAGTVSGERGQLIYSSSDAEPQPSEVRFDSSLTSADQTVLTGVSLASVTGVTAVVRWFRYDGVDKGEDVMEDEFRGDLRAAFVRNIGEETMMRFQAKSKTWGSLLNAATIRLAQNGTDIVAKTIGTCDQWFDNIPSKTKDPWAWDGPNDGARRRGPEFIKELSGLVFKLARPADSPTWDTQVSLEHADSTKSVSYVFKPGANRRLTAVVKSLSGMPQAGGEVHVYDRAIVSLACQSIPSGYEPTYWGLWQGNNTDAADIYVHEGGKMITNMQKQNSGYGQTIAIDGGTYAFRDSWNANEYSTFLFLRGYFIVDCVEAMEYRNGAVSEGYGPYLGAMGRSSTITVRGDKPCFCRNGYGLYSNKAYTSAPQTCTLDVDDVTADAAVDFTMEEPFWWKNYPYARLVKTGAGTALFMKKNDLAEYSFLVKNGTLLMGMKDGLGTKGVELAGGTLAIQAGLTNSVDGALSLTATSGIRLAGDSQIVIADSSAETWATGARLNITGDPAKSSITFGPNGLTVGQLGQIRWNGKRVVMNEDGTLKQYIPGAILVVR